MTHDIPGRTISVGDVARSRSRCRHFLTQVSPCCDHSDFMCKSPVSSEHDKQIDTMVMVLWGIDGISAAAWFDYAVLKAPNHDAWRIALAMPAFFLVISLILAHGWPDSPQSRRSVSTRKVLLGGDGSPTKNLRRI